MKKKITKNKGQNKRKTVILPVTFGKWDISYPVFNGQFTTIGGIAGIVVNILNFFVGASAVVAVGLIVYAGITYMSAGGSPDNVKKARNILTAALVGMSIVFLARMLISFILTTFLL